MLGKDASRMSTGREELQVRCDGHSQGHCVDASGAGSEARGEARGETRGRRRMRGIGSSNGLSATLFQHSSHIPPLSARRGAALTSYPGEAVCRPFVEQRLFPSSATMTAAVQMQHGASSRLRRPVPYSYFVCAFPLIHYEWASTAAETVPIPGQSRLPTCRRPLLASLKSELIRQRVTLMHFPGSALA